MPDTSNFKEVKINGDEIWFNINNFYLPSVHYNSKHLCNSQQKWPPLSVQTNRRAGNENIILRFPLDFQLPSTCQFHRSKQETISFHVSLFITWAPFTYTGNLEDCWYNWHFKYSVWFYWADILSDILVKKYHINCHGFIP